MSLLKKIIFKIRSVFLNAKSSVATAVFSPADEVWMRAARGYLGTKEIAGELYNNTIARWLSGVGAGPSDEVAWCAAFVDGVLKECGYKSTSKANARSFLDYGSPCEFTPGAIVVLWRGTPTSWKGHVGFAEEMSSDGKMIRILGGNQHNMVSSEWYGADRILGFRWPVKA